ncbi:hypothetical protein GCM10009117_06680 [Gangjinia marincola]|uniref:Uncharacterized protein n=1 Tax=Gangjinia marincola TaxID=578463 RepID=A0ABP3XTC8_9FLAO
MSLHKIFKYIALALGVIGAILLARVIITGDTTIEESADVQSSVVDPFMYVSYIVLAVVIGLVLVFVIKGLFSGDIKKTLISVGLFLAVFALGYVLSSGDNLNLEPFIKKGQDVTESTSKWVGTGLIVFYVLAAAAILSMVFSGAKKAISR